MLNQALLELVVRCVDNRNSICAQLRLGDHRHGVNSYAYELTMIDMNATPLHRPAELGKNLEKLVFRPEA